ncbi:MAG TPA: hypothetical protein VGG26_08640 [Terracidiphilus sp.]|jgi:flagellar motility protein MotE (MotC chaperone)
MKFRFSAAVSAMLAISLVASHAQTSDAARPAARHAARRPKTPPGPSVEEQIETLRLQLQTQIDTLKSDLAGKDAQLKQAQQQAADAQAAAARAQAAADSQQQTFTENAAAVSTLQSTVTDMKSANAAVVSSLTDETSAIKKAIANPDAINYKGITISPAGSFLAAETVWRQGGTGGGLNTQFTGVPLNHSEAAQLTEFQGSGRQSRVAIKAVGKLANFTMTGYYEADWLSSGVTSNNNQSNSYTMRQRQLWADAKTATGWDFSGGQGWSMATETTQGLTRGTEILPASIDPQYMAGFVWTRQYSFRVSKDFDKKFFMGISAENAETLNPAGQNLPTNLLITTVGNTGGLYDNQSNYSYNLTPDFIAKIAIEPGWGHWELFGIGRSFRDRIYPTTGAAFNNTVWGGGIGGGFRAPVASKKVTIGLKGLWGEGVGRYGSSTIADVTIRPNGTLSPLHGFSAISTLEMNPTSRLNLYFNYGGDYIGRDIALSGTTQVGYGTYSANMSGCRVENASTAANAAANPGTPTNCTANTKDVQEFSAGYWYNIYAGPKGRLRQGIQYSLFERNLWSGAGGTANPGGGATGTDNMWWTSFRYYLP